MPPRQDATSGSESAIPRIQNSSTEEVKVLKNRPKGRWIRRNWDFGHEQLVFRGVLEVGICYEDVSEAIAVNFWTGKWSFGSFSAFDLKIIGARQLFLWKLRSTWGFGWEVRPFKFSCCRITSEFNVRMLSAANQWLFMQFLRVYFVGIPKHSTFTI
jgi:hypothetical protein